MKLGFVSALLPEFGFDQVIDFAGKNGFGCVEIMCWPRGQAERRYAGVTHIDVAEMDEAQAERIKATLAEKKVEISALGYYPNPLDSDLQNRAFYVAYPKMPQGRSYAGGGLFHDLYR